VFISLKRSGEQIDDRIVEVHWDPEMSRWRMMRFRDDKPNGNHRSVVENIIQSIAEGVEKEAVSSVLSPRLLSSTSKLITNRNSFSHSSSRDVHPSETHGKPAPVSHLSPCRANRQRRRRTRLRACVRRLCPHRKAILGRPSRPRKISKHHIHSNHTRHNKPQLFSTNMDR